MKQHHKKYYAVLALLVVFGVIGVVATAQAQCSPSDLMCFTAP